MNYRCIKQKVIAPLLVLPLLVGATSVLAQDTYIDTSILDRATEAAEITFAQAVESQERVVQLSDESDDLVARFNVVTDTVDGLEVYNAKMRSTIEEQERKIAEYDASIATVAELQRQIPPLMEKMLVALEQFVDMDLPFQLKKRHASLATVRGTFDDSNVNVAEKFRLLLQAYTLENNAGRSMDHFEDRINVGDGVERDVDLLKVGRVALIYQTKDQTETGMWDQQQRAWVVLGDEYRRPITQAIRMAQNLTTTEIIELPILAPESAR